jgi:hypothetical protein
MTQIGPLPLLDDSNRHFWTGGAPSPMEIRSVRIAMASTSRSADAPTATTTDTAMHLSPADPYPADTAASAARSMSASGRTIMWFFAPPSACTRFPFADAVRWMCLATGVEPTKLTPSIAGCSRR